MHHKRKGPKSTRCGCLLCKPHKRQGTELKNRARMGNVRRMAGASLDLRAEGFDKFDRGIR
jgi:hypothetical protein